MSKEIYVTHWAKVARKNEDGSVESLNLDYMWEPLADNDPVEKIELLPNVTEDDVIEFIQTVEKSDYQTLHKYRIMEWFGVSTPPQQAWLAKHQVK